MATTFTRVKKIEMIDWAKSGGHVHVTSGIVLDGHAAGPRSINPAIRAPMWDVRREAHGAIVVTVLFNADQVEISEPIERDGVPGGFYREVTVVCLDGFRLTPWRPDEGLTFRFDDPQPAGVPGVFNVRKLGTTWPEQAVVHQDFVGVEMFAEQVLFRNDGEAR